MNDYTVYIKVDTDNNITAINSSAFLSIVEDWIEVDRGEGDKYHHAQSNYLNKGLLDAYGRYNYKFINGRVVEIPEYEKPLIPRPEPTVLERLEALEVAMLEVILNGYISSDANKAW